MTMRVHITLKKGYTEDDLEKLVSLGRLANINMPRLHDYGILSCDAPEDVTVRIGPLVKSITVDGQKRTQKDDE